MDRKLHSITGRAGGAACGGTGSAEAVRILQKEFSPERERQRYCSKACSAAAYNASRRAQTRASYRVPDGIGTRKGRIPPYLNGQRAPKDNREWIIYDTYQAHRLGLSYGQYKARQTPCAAASVEQ